MCTNESVSKTAAIVHHQLYPPSVSPVAPHQPHHIGHHPSPPSGRPLAAHHHSPPSYLRPVPSADPVATTPPPNQTPSPSHGHHPGAPSLGPHLPAANNNAATAAAMSSILSSVPATANLLPLDHYRLQLYNYAMAERLRCTQQQQQQQQQQHHSQSQPQAPPSGYPGATLCPTAAGPYAAPIGPYGPRLALSMSLFHHHHHARGLFQPEEPKPQHSYIGLIAMAILSSVDQKLVLSDIYQHILDNYPYFRSRGPGWRNSIRHNLSLNDCFVKAGRSANGKGHYWAIHPANLDDFKKGDFRRRKAQRKVRKHMGLAVDDEGTDSPSPPPMDATGGLTPPPMSAAAAAAAALQSLCAWRSGSHHPMDGAHHHRLAMPLHHPAAMYSAGLPATAATTVGPMGQSRKRPFDVASLLAPDEPAAAAATTLIVGGLNHHHHHHHLIATTTTTHHHHHHVAAGGGGPGAAAKRMHHHSLVASTEIEEDIDVVASDDTDTDDTPTATPVQPDAGAPHASDAAATDEPRPHAPHHPIHHPQSQHQHHQHQWPSLMQQWPSQFAAAAAAAAMDPRLLSRYYGQYMAAAQHHAQQQQQQQHQHRRPPAGGEHPDHAEQHHQSAHHHQQQHQPRTPTPTLLLLPSPSPSPTGGEAPPSTHSPGSSQNECC